MLTTICYRLKNKNTYALEGSIFIAGAGVQWLRDKIRLIDNAYETEKIAKSKKVMMEFMLFLLLLVWVHLTGILNQEV